MKANGNFFGLISCIILFQLVVITAQVKINATIQQEVKDLSVAVKSYSDRFVARDSQNIIVLTPKELVFKIRGQKSLRLQLKKGKERIYLRAKPTR